MIAANLKIVSWATAMDEITHKHEKGSARKRAKCRTLENKSQVNPEEGAKKVPVGGPGKVSWKCGLEICMYALFLTL